MALFIWWHLQKTSYGEFVVSFGETYPQKMFEGEFVLTF
jgi:hypothetical protein